MKPENWTDAQVLEFLGVALRNVDLVGEVGPLPKEVRQGFQYMAEKYGTQQAATVPDVSALISALETIAAGERVVERDGHSEVENDTTIDYPAIAIEALAAYRAAPAEADRRDAEYVETLKCCRRWFERHSPTAPLIGGFGEAEHPMLTLINAALAKGEGND